MAQNVELLVSRGWESERVLDMSLHELWLWSHVALKNIYKEAEVYGVETSNRLAEIMAALLQRMPMV